MAPVLEEKISSVEDITGSEAFDEVLIYLDQIQMQDEEFMEKLLARRNDMIISWELPWYQKSNCLTKKVFDNELQEEAGQKESFRTDAVSSDESLKIEKNWHKLRKLFDLPDTPICLARWKNISKSRNPKAAEECARRFVIAFLAQGLERNLHQVYRHFVVRYGYHAKGYYTAYEEKVMQICLYHMPRNPVPTISLILGRDPRGIYKRLNQNEKEPLRFEKRKWTLPLSTQFLQLLMKHTSLPLKKLKNKTFDRSIWFKLQDEMQYSRMNLQYHWYHTLHAQLFVKRDVKRNRLRRKLFKRIAQMPYKVWSDIRWKELAKFYRDGFTPIFLYRQCYQVVRKHGNFIRTPLSELVPIALELIDTLQSKRLQTLILNENEELEEYIYSDKDIEV